MSHEVTGLSKVLMYSEVKYGNGGLSLSLSLFLIVSCTGKIKPVRVAARSKA
jgi:hypothetical protein